MSITVYLDRNNEAAWKKGGRGEWDLSQEAKQWMVERGFTPTIWEAEHSRYEIFGSSRNDGPPGVTFAAVDHDVAMLFKLTFGGR